MDRSRSSVAATELHEWFQGVERLAHEGLFGIAPEGPHRSAVILDVLKRNARLLVDAELDHNGTLYTPVTLVLVAGSKKLGIALRAGHWRAAVENVLDTRERMRSLDMTAAWLDLGDPAAVFFAELKEALRQSGVAGVPSYLDDGNRRIALGLALNWAMRFLLAYALGCKTSEHLKGRKDLSWIARVLSVTADS